MPLAGGVCETVAEFPAGFNLRDICFSDRGTLLVTGAGAGAVVEIAPPAVSIPEPATAVTAAGVLAALAFARRLTLLR
jgi:hypothetical protein